MRNKTYYATKAFVAQIISMVWLLVLTACTPLLPQGVVRGPETYRVETDIETQGFPRNYHLHIPPAYDDEKKTPMVVVVHGSFETAKTFEKMTQFSALADRENFIVLYPNGIGILGFLQHWNAGHCCGKAAKDQIDDVGFVAAAIEQTKNRLKVDHNKIYMIGFSNGGMFVHRFAAEKGTTLTGAAVLAGSICSYSEEGPSKWQMPQPAAALPMLMMHAEDDPSVPFYGEKSQRGGGPSTYCTVAESVDFWLKNNGCTEPSTNRTLFKGVVELKQWTNCTNKKPVALYAIKDWGHVWPGRYYTEKLSSEHPLKGFDAAEIAWFFFKQLSR